MPPKKESTTGPKHNKEKRADGEFENAFYASGNDLLAKVKSLIHEGNIRRIIVKNESGETLVVIPLTFGIIGVALAPLLALIGVIAALGMRCMIVVEKK